MSYQHAGDEGRPAGLSVFLQRAQGQAGQPASRQQDGGSLPHQRGGYQIPRAVKPSSGHSHVVSGAQCCDTHLLCPMVRQYTSGRLVSQQETGRVASIPSSGLENFISPGAASSRSVWVTADSTAGDVYDIGSEGKSSTGSRCAGSGVGFQAGLRVFTPQPGTNSVISTGRVPVQNAAYRPMLVRHLLATDYLESPVRPTAQATLAQGSGDSCPVRSTTEAAELSPSDTMTCFRRSVGLQKFSQPVQQVLEKSWSPGTKIHYATAWRSWEAWCKGRNLDSNVVHVERLLDYLNF